MGGIGARIRKLREEAGLSQEKLAARLGVTRPAVTQIEKGQRKLSADELKILSGVFQVSADVLLDLEREPKIVVKKVKGKKAGRRKETLRISVPQKNLERFKQILLYILNEVGSKPNVGQTVLYKLLYFIDFNFYEKYEEQLIGATYIKNTYGPTPIEFKLVLDKMIRDEEVVEVKSKHFQYPQTKYLPLVEPDLSGLQANEKQVIDNVLHSRLSDMTATQISKYSHGDVPWLSAEDGELLEYESVFCRTPAYSVREYDEDVQ